MKKCTRKPVTHKNAPLVPWLGAQVASAVGGKNVRERQGEPQLPMLLCLSIVIFYFCLDDLAIVFTANTKNGNMKDHSREVCH